MKMSDAQFGALNTLREFGPKEAIEVVMPPSMDGREKVRLEWNVASSATLAKLEAAGLVVVNRQSIGRPSNAVGKRGHERRKLTISISDAGRMALEEA